MSKKLLLFFVIGSTMLIANAQQLPNYGFNNWKTACANTESFGSTTGMRQRPGVEPSEWNGSSVNQKVGVEKRQELIYNDNSAVKMVNTYVGVNLGITKIGSVAPGFITLGTPWVYATSKVKECNGGVYGGVNFSYKPDAITGKYKRTDTTGEKSHIIAYLWNGTFKSKVGSVSSPSEERENTEYAILGKTTPTASGKLIASCDYSFTSTTNSDWQTITVPLDYKDTNSAPTMMNVIISGGSYWDRANLKENTTLIADDIRFVYYSTLKTLSYNGVAQTIPAVGGTLNMSTVEYNANKLSYTLNGQTATATTSYNESNALLTITVSNIDNDIDGKSSHTYYIQFATPHVHGGYTYTANGASLTATCTCNESMGTISMVLPTDLTYNGKAKEVSLQGAISGVSAPNVVYSTGTAPVNAGTYTASITLGNTTATTTFTIQPKTLSNDVTVEGLNSDYTYTGSAIKPEFSVTYGSQQLEKGKDYTLSFSDNTNVGTAKATITFIGNYIGCVELTFTISSVSTSIEQEEVNADQPVVYYNLRGVRVTEPQKGEIYIVNGKKILW